MSSLPIIERPPCTTAGLGSSASDSQQGPSLIALLLDEQQDMSAVARFANYHDTVTTPAAEKHYRALMPATPPGPGQQYGFEVDLDRCSGCKACVTSCHSLNGLDESETWRDVGLLIGGTRSQPVMQHVTTACHHCISPACMIACPVNAYEKDPLTGIVKHLDDQCFGCQYCTMACPYDVPKYNPAKGIVRKCDMCSTRLAAGEAPACVQACPHQAISIHLVDVAAAIVDAEAAVFLPAAPDPQITYPTTTFKTRRVFPRNLLPIDHFQVSRQHPHLPLVIMLVLTQLSVGAYAAGMLLQRVLPSAEIAPLQSLHGLTALVFGLVALAASTLHLGRPRFAYRAILGLGHSWMSREILAFGLFAALACMLAAAKSLPLAAPIDPRLLEWLELGVVASGAAGIFGSVMIYATLGRDYWSFVRTGLRFALSAALLGAATAWLTAAVIALVQPEAAGSALLRTIGGILCPAIVVVAAVKLLWEAALFRHLLGRSMSQMKRSALLAAGELSSCTLARFAAGLVGGIVIPLVLMAKLRSEAPQLDPLEIAALSLLLFVACVLGELLERYLFFAAVAAPRMPGGLR